MLPTPSRRTLEGRKEMAMVHIRTSTVIRRSQEETFDYLTDIRNAKEWAVELVEVAYDGDLRDGATGVDTRRMGRKLASVPWVVTAYERPERIAFEYGGRFPATADFTFRAEDGGTRVTCETDLRLRGGWRLLAPVFAAEARKVDRAQFDKVKAILESRPVGVDPGAGGSRA